uniref:Uncharacterized protein n=1 Tax=Anguilla anguilla TaxID=7936 RepID=A0A0E9PSB7_ANGAN
MFELSNLKHIFLRLYKQNTKLDNKCRVFCIITNRECIYKL